MKLHHKMCRCDILAQYAAQTDISNKLCAHVMCCVLKGTESNILKSLNASSYLAGTLSSVQKLAIKIT